jgi:glyoxylase-like metal-dependent hydrolase (beta-lactamase superfamily II)/ferredoxin
VANRKNSYLENSPGDFFVDSTCIDCDLCRQIAPSVFRDAGDYSVVYHQPKEPEEVKRALDAFPELIEGNVFFCGYASANSYGAASYLIQRPQGNVLIDSPRFAGQLVRKLEQMGGVALMFLTHRDDVADHARFHDHFGCRRIIHKDDARSISAERVLEGQEAVSIDDELRVVPVPGHTRGHAVLLYRDKFLFTGDHLAWSDNRDGLIAFRSVAWYSWREQTQSMKRLLDLHFEWVLPGHGRRAHRPANLMHQELVKCIAWMETVP